MIKLFKKVVDIDNVGWAESPTIKLCWGGNPNLQKSSVGRIWKRSIKNFPCHPELVSGSYHRQKFSTICAQKSNVGQVCTTYNNITLNTEERSIIVSCLRHYSPRKAAFTLAEVLITLGIIGVVAAMTLPTLIAKYKDYELANRTRKTVSVINQAIQLAQAAYGTPGDNSSMFNISKSSPEVTKEFSKYFNGAQYCTADTNNKRCMDLHYSIKYNKAAESTSGTTATAIMYNFPRIVLGDGTVIAIYQYQTEYDEYEGVVHNPNGSIKKDENGNIIYTTYRRSTLADIRFDVNGSKSPNQFGRDAFILMVYKNKIAIEGSFTYGPDSLKNILNGGLPIYSDYVPGAPFEW